MVREASFVKREARPSPILRTTRYEIRFTEEKGWKFDYKN